MDWTAREIASRLEAKALSGYWMAKCPAHEDSTPSFSIREHNGKPSLTCFKGCSWLSIKDALEARGITLGPGRELQIETVYVVKDAAGKQIAEHVRVDKGIKDKIVFWRPKFADLGIRLVDMPLYGVELLAARPGEPVIITEGEKAAEAVRRMGLIGLGTVTGANATPCDASLEAIKGRTAYLWADNDDEGRRHMANIAKSLTRLGIKHVPVTWPDAPAKGDAADFVGLGRGVDEFWKLTPQTKRLRALWQGATAAYDELDRYSRGDFSDRVTTGIDRLDRRLRGGLRGGQMTLLGAPTGSGKTTLVQQVAVAAAKQRRGAVLLVSPEMSLESLAEREIVRRSRSPVFDRNPWTNVDDYMKQASERAHGQALAEIVAEKLPILVLEDLEVAMAGIESAAADAGRLALVIIDYAQYVAGEGSKAVPRYLQVGEVAERSVELAIRLNVPVLVASQVNVAKEGNRRTFTFRESQILEHKAHTVLVMDVAWTTNENTGERSVERTDIVCTKNRGAATFTLKVHYEPHLYSITDDQPWRPAGSYPLLAPSA